MQFSKAAVLILSAVSAASAEFPVRTTSTVKSARGVVKNLFQKVQTAAGRRLQTGPMSPECAAACDGMEDVIKVYMENMEAIEKGDSSVLCPHMDTITCMEGAAACQEASEEKEEEAHEDHEGHDHEEEEHEEDGMGCICACPDMAKMEMMKDEEFCDAGNPLECVLKESKCANTKKEILKGGSQDDYEKGMELHCAIIAAECEKKGAELGTCAAEDLGKWESAGCDKAAYEGTIADKADDCCPAGAKIMECYSVECSKLNLKAAKLKAGDGSAEEKAAMQKEMDKDFAIGKACPATGLPTSEADLEPPPPAAAAGTTDSAWASLPHVIPFVGMVGSLLA